MFYEDAELREMELRVLERAHLKVTSLKNPQAARHLKEGFIRRHIMMESSRIFIREKTRPLQRKPLDPYLATELNIHVNAYYLNLCGSLDNLAWCLMYELGLNPTVTEEDRSRSYCNLFGDRFLNDLGGIKGKIAATIRERIDWNREVREFRDPAAHRIPLYMPPGVLRETQLEEFRRIEEQASKSEKERSGLPRSHFLEKARELAKYSPIMVSSTSSGLQIHSIPDQLAKDQAIFLQIADTVISAL